tara:strand:+ start:160 stop:906 length:747 start_codon:yes stop_codon:yes gene_type:complete
LKYKTKYLDLKYFIGGTSSSESSFKPKMLLCVLGGGISTETDYGSFASSALGKIYRDAIRDDDCDILIIDPLTGGGLYRPEDKMEFPEVKAKTIEFIKRFNEHGNVNWVNEAAELFNYDLIFKDKKYSDGGICILNDLKGTDDRLFKETREKVYKKLSENILESTVPISLCEIGLENIFTDHKTYLFWSKQMGIVEKSPLDIQKEIKLHLTTYWSQFAMKKNNIKIILPIVGEKILIDVHREITNTVK